MSRRIVRGLVVPSAVVLALTSCGGGSDGGGDQREEPPPLVPTMTQDELLATLPTLADVEEGSEITQTCPADAECEPPTVADVQAVHASRDFVLAPRGTPAEIEEQAGGSGLDNLLFVRVEQWPDAGVAEQRLVHLRDDDADVDGDFEVPIEDSERGYSPGRAGTGEVEQVDVAGRPGQVTTYEATFTFRGVEPEQRFGAEVSVLVDDVVVHLLSSTSATGWDGAELRSFALDLASDVVERLPSETD